MHIIFNSSEEIPTDLKDGTTLVEQNDDGKYIKAYEIKNNNLVLTKDLADNDRDWYPGEEEEFIKNADFSKEAIIDFFLIETDSGNAPYRVWKLYSSANDHKFKYVYHDGQVYSEEKERYFGHFQIRMSSKGNLDTAAEEFDLLLSRTRKYLDYPIRVGIMEDSLSEFGIYEAVVEKDKISVMKTTYGSTRTIETFSKPKDFLKFLKENLSYN